jgi:hypothetical protein
MNKKTPPSQPSPKTEPDKDPFLGDLTPQWILWHEATHSPEEHLERYRDRIPHEYAELHGIKRIF